MHGQRCSLPLSQARPGVFREVVTPVAPPLRRPHFAWDLRSLRPHLMRETDGVERLVSPTLYLFATDGRVFEWGVEESGQGFLIDGYLYRPGGGC